MKKTSREELIAQAEKTVIYTEGHSKDRQYLQTVIVCGRKCEQLWTYLDNYNPPVIVVVMPPDGIAVIGAGPFFAPFFATEMEFKCVDWMDDLLNTLRVQACCDLTHLIKYLRFGGENGNSTSSI